MKLYLRHVFCVSTIPILLSASVLHGKNKILLKKYLTRQEVIRKIPDLFRECWGIACVQLKQRHRYEKWIPALFATDPVANTVVFSIGLKDAETYGDEPNQPQFSSPKGIAAAPDGSVYVADTGNNCIVKLFFDERKLTFIKKKTGFLKPQGVAVDNAGNVYVADTGNNRIIKLTPDLQPANDFHSGKNWFGTYGNSSGNLAAPGALCINEEGDIFIAELANRRISKFNRFGRFIGLIQAGFFGFGNANSLLLGIAHDMESNLFVVDGGNNTIWKLNRELKLTAVYPTCTELPFRFLRGVAMDKVYGRLFVIGKESGYMYMVHPFKPYPKEIK